MNLILRLCFTLVFLSLVLVSTGCQQDKSEQPAGESGIQTEEGAVENQAEPADTEEKTINQQMENAEGTVREGAARAGEYLDDTAITAQIKMEMMQDPLLKNAKVTVTTTAGVVTFSGTVPSQEYADKAIQIATYLPEVVSVENQLKIGTE